MRVRAVLAGLAIGAGLLLGAAPAVFADQAPPTTSSSASTVKPPTSEPTTSSSKPAPPTVSKTSTKPAATLPQAPVAVKVKPKGAPETGGGGTASVWS
jgi:hypothetical protein